MSPGVEQLKTTYQWECLNEFVQSFTFMQAKHILINLQYRVYQSISGIHGETPQFQLVAT